MKKKEVCILITSSGGIATTGIIDCLKNNYENRKIRVVCTDIISQPLLMYKSDKFYLVPKGNSRKYVNAILKICKKEKVDVIFPGSGSEIFTLSKNTKIFRQNNVVVATSNHNSVKIIMDKVGTYDLLRKNDGKIGTYHRGIELNYNNACNLRCKYCFTNSPKGDHVKDFLPISKIKEIADEADELGFIEWDLQGGELLLWPDKLFNVLDAIKPERFYLYLTTNGFNADRKMIKELAKHGVSRMSVSIDSMDPEFHDEMRGRKDSWRRAIQALEYVQEAGMDPYLNVTVGHYNAKSEDLRLLLDYSKKENNQKLI